MKYTRIGDLLVGNGTITQEQLEQALKLQKGSGKRLGDVLQENNIITEEQLIEALMAQLGLEYIDLNSYNIPSEMAKMLPKSIARKHKVVPVRATRTDLYLAMSDPLNFMAIEEARAATRHHIVPMIATESATERALQNLYNNQGAMKAIEDMRKDLSSTPQAIALYDSSKVEMDDDDEDAAPTIRLVNSIIERACTENASDIHIEPLENELKIRMRIDGVLRSIIVVPRELQMSVISRIKIMSKLDIAKKNVPQDGKIKIIVRGEVLDLRVSTLPTTYGEKIVIRLLRKDKSRISFEGIGLIGKNRELFEGLIKNNREGVILVVGPTGSGKTSTMYTMIDYVKSEEVNLISLEDPVEYAMENVCQVQINDKTDLTFANALRAVLRQDPDIIAIGEIRDGETAEIAMRSAMTGHLVLSTLHTNDAVSTIDRLIDIGVEPYLISGAVRGIISQRLLRCICPKCKKGYKPSIEELKMLNLSDDEERTFYRGEGCSECFQTGYRGRTAVFEILVFNPDIRKALNSGNSNELNQAIAKSGFSSILDNCIELVENGSTTVDEVFRWIGKK